MNRPARRPRVVLTLSSDASSFRRMGRWSLALFIAGIAVVVAGCGGGAGEGRSPDLTVADINILHGSFCSAETEKCRLADRIELLFDWIEAERCPDIVTLQEVTPPALTLITERLADGCPFRYETTSIFSRFLLDETLVLSRYPVIESESRVLVNKFRYVLFARIDHPLGPVDVFSTHLASGSDAGSVPCRNCPDECTQAGAVTFRDCQAVQLADFVAARHDISGPAVITGDFNDTPHTFVYDQFVGRGWGDVYLAAGNPECDPATGVGCTSGREDQALDDMESPASNETERIDYIFLVPSEPEFGCAARIDSMTDDDGDGMGTHLFAGDSNPFAPVCGPRPAPICWPSDHIGVQLDLDCDGGD